MQTMWLGRVPLTWFGSLRHRAVVNLVLELWPVVIHINDIDVKVNGVLHLVPIHVHSMRSELLTHTNTHTSVSKCMPGVC